MYEVKYWLGWPFIKTQAGVLGSNRRRRQQTENQLNQQRKLLQLLDTGAPGCALGVENIQISNLAIDEVNAWIDEQDNANRATVHLRRFLRAGLAKGAQELGWQVELPPTEMTIISEKNSITPDGFIQLAQLRNQIKAFEERLVNQPNNPSVSLTYGQLLFSATVFGGLADSKAMLQLPYAKEKIRHYKDYVWIDLFTDDYPKHIHADRGLRRWFPDPVSLILLTRLPELPQGYEDKSKLRRWLNQALAQFIYSLSGDVLGRTTYKEQQALIRHWLATVSVYQHTVLPPYLVRHCTGESSSTAWPESVWLRVLKQQALLLSSADKSYGLTLDEPEPTISPVALTINDNKKNLIFTGVRTALYKSSQTTEPSLKTLLERLGKLKAEAVQASPLLYCLIDWVKKRLRKTEIRRSTAYQQLTSLGKTLLSTFDEAELLSLTAEDFQAGYETILESTPSAITRQNKADLLRRFHAHASNLLQLAPIKLSYADEVFFALPDANTFTETEYQLLYQFLKAQKDTSPITHAQLIVLILGYRCGLRISEIRHLQLDDLQYPGMLEILPTERLEQLGRYAATLLIRGDQFNKLKSKNSRRQLPLNILMSSKERVELLNYHQAQRVKVGKRKVQGKFIFSEDNGKTPMDFTELQRNLHEQMRQLTGDPDLRFHHLRHSFASHALQASHNLTEPLQLPAHWQGHMLQGTSRKHLHQISNYVGHSSGNVTLQHYTHNLDCIVRDLLWPHSFDHRKTGFGEKQRYRGSLDVALCVQSLLDISADNLRQHNRQYGGKILGWLPQRLKLQPAIDPKQWRPYSETLAKLVAGTSNKSRDLRDFSFENWCDFLQRWSQSHSGDELIEMYKLDDTNTRAQVTLLSGLLKARTRFNNSRLKQPRKIFNTQVTASSHYFIIRPPRYKLERDIAAQTYKNSLRLLQSAQNGELAKTALKYFYDNYRHWDKSVICRHDPGNLPKLQVLEHFLRKVLPNDKVHVWQERNPAVHRYPMIGKLQIVTVDKQKPRDGAVFGLLLAYFRAVLGT
ncbi:site-specific integrase [Thiopseudomonas alkaliphila]|uniref:Site-specific integrase n=1 Tax=Thiopseudomonas alkaliphila TaxID=1697053 RepID=A0AAW7DUC2_9GAMM|nr:site-specific integrase [Thiopseudomonas alkaliphila]MDM1697232.1 site-specific integrase [Thiopseudomonas alkaliphila]